MIFRNFAPADSNCRDNKPKVQHLNQSKKARTDFISLNHNLPFSFDWKWEDSGIKLTDF